MYGYPIQYVRNQSLTILNPPKFEQQPQFHKFWIGRRLHDDEELLYATQKSPSTFDRTAHKLNIDIQFEYYITYIGVAVNVSLTTTHLAH